MMGVWDGRERDCGERDDGWKGEGDGGWRGVWMVDGEEGGMKVMAGCGRRGVVGGLLI